MTRKRLLRAAGWPRAAAGAGRCYCLLLLWLAHRAAASLSWRLEHDQRANEVAERSKEVAMAAVAAAAVLVNLGNR